LKVISAEFVTSAAAGGATDGIPHDGLPQIAMAGRSNVGKSTLLNALCRKKIARTSAAPGKTRLANVYRITVEGGGPGTRSLYLVDLPGYGYARGGANGAAELKAVGEAYFSAASPTPIETPVTRGLRPAPKPASIDTGAPLKRRATGVGALLLVDSRHPGLDSDIQAARWLESMTVDYRVVATKIDKLSRSERARNLKTLELTLGMPPLPVSAASGEGLDALWKTIASLARTGHA
jgi:GTP-binding protein